MKFMHLNCRSLLPKWDEINQTLLKSGIDVLVLSETWLHANINDSLIYNENYKVYRLDRKVKLPSGVVKKGGGLCMFIRNNIKVEHDQAFFLSDGDIEVMHLNLKKGFESRINVVGIYRPPNGNLTLGLDKLNGILKDVKQTYKGELTVLGDFNIDYKIQTDRSVQRLKDMETDFGLTQVIESITRRTAKHETMIDLIFTDMKFVSKSGVIDMAISDHYLTFLVKKKERNCKDSKTITCRSFNNFDLEAFKADLRLFNFASITDLDIEEAWTLLWNHIIQTCDYHCPVVTFTARLKPDYIDNELMRRMKHRDRAFRVAWKSGKPEDLNHAKSLRQNITKDLRTIKRKFILTQLNLTKGNAKKFWNVINTSFFMVQGISMTQILDDKTNNLLSGFLAAEYVNSYFCNISKNMSVDLPTPDVNDLNIDIDRTNLSEDWPPLLNSDVVLNRIKKIDISKASGFPQINSRLLKEALACLHVEFTHVLNLGLEQCRFPGCWKSATVVVIPKKGNSTLASNLRPISLLPLTGKIMEFFINQYLITFMTEQNLFAPQQMGFRKDYSTTECCFTLVKDILDATNEGLISIAIYIDLAKAFNTVNHSILIRKLTAIGLPKKFIKLLISYLELRTQHTIFDGCTSGEDHIIDGVPQGSILGPTLFLCYINDLPNMNLGCKVCLYADDTVLYLSGADEETIVGQLNYSLYILGIWCRDNRLTVNAGKTKAMVFNAKKSEASQIPKLMYNQEPLEFVDKYLYLGVTVDNNLNFLAHVNKIISACNQKLFTLSKIRKYITQGIAITLYKSLILPILDYGDVFYSCVPNTYLDKIQKLQNKALRIVDLSPRYTSNIHLHNKYQVIPLYIRRRNNLLKLVHTYLRHNLDDLDVSWENYVPTEGQYDRIITRQAATPFIPLRLPRSEKYKSSCAYSGPKLWLDQSTSIRQIADHEEFKCLLKRMAQSELPTLRDVYR